MKRKRTQIPGRPKINFNTLGKKYCVLTGYSGLPAADYYKLGKITEGLIVPHDVDSSADLKT